MPVLIVYLFQIVLDRGATWIEVGQYDMEIPETVLRACPGTVQGETGWYRLSRDTNRFYAYDTVGRTWKAYVNPFLAPIEPVRDTVMVSLWSFDSRNFNIRGTYRAGRRGLVY